jgi:adenylosuccinate lyase
VIDLTSFAHIRYRTDIADLFTEEKKLELQLQVEKELTYANFKVGKIPKEAYDEIYTYCTPAFITLKRIKELEEETHHDLMSVVLAISERCPQYGGYVHLGATSNDIQDTVLGLQLQQAKDQLLDHIEALIDELIRLSKENVDLVCIGRTHGQHALPITYGFKFANFLSEISLAKNNLEQTTVNYGKMSGAVGNYASFGTRDVEDVLLKRLNLKRLPITTQIVPRIVHSKFLFALSLIASSLERLAKEIRNLQRTEISELNESFKKTQVGSSTMPHKRNPHKSERICGIAKYLRAMVGIGLENISLEHERDLTNSSSERVTIPETITLTDFIILEMTKILKELVISEDKILENLNMTQGRVCAERLMLALTDKIGRQKAHKILNNLASEQGNYIDTVKNSPVKDYLTNDEITSLLDPITYTGLSKEVVLDYLKQYKQTIPINYAESGVDIEKEKSDITIIGDWVKKTFEFGKVSEKFGHYANTIALEEYELGLTTDGVGSKLLIAEMMDKYDTIGIDCVAMNVNDLLCLGMKPLAFVDYIATEKSLGKKKAEQVAKGLYEGCKEVKIPILGGEMATLPDIVKGFDLAGTALGIAKKGTLVDGSTIEPRDIVIGLASNGIHSNGLTLARKVLLPKMDILDKLSNGITLGEELLRPTKIYNKEILSLLEKIPVKGIAHITGGGFKKLLRLTNYGFRMDYLPMIPPIFVKIQQLGKISSEEMFSTFNMGVGMVIVVTPEHRNSALNHLRQFGDAWEIGVITEEKQKIHIVPFDLKLGKE